MFTGMTQQPTRCLFHMMIERIIDLLGRSLFVLMLLFVLTSPISAVACWIMGIPIYTGEVTMLSLHAATGVFLSGGVFMAVIFSLSLPE